MLRSENSLNEDLIDIMMEDEKAGTQPARIATPPRPSKLEIDSHSRSPSPFANSPADMESPISFTHQPNGVKPHLLAAPVPIKHSGLHHVSPTKDRHQFALSIANTVVNHNAKSNGLDGDGQNGKPVDGDKPVSHTSSPDVNKIRQFRNRLYPTYKTLSSPHINTGPTLVSTSVQEASADQPPPEPIELRIYQCDDVKMNRVVSSLAHTNTCSAQKCNDLCEYIKWFINHRKNCPMPCKGERCDHCHQFFRWQYRHCVNCHYCAAMETCPDSISWCATVKQSILTTRLNGLIAPLVEKLKNKCWLDSAASCPRYDCINQHTLCRSQSEIHQEILKEHLLFGCTQGKFVENEHWMRCERVGTGRAGSCWLARLVECPFEFAVKETSLDHRSSRARRNLDEVYCSIKMKYLREHVCPHIIDYYGVTAVRQPIENLLPFMDPPLVLQIYMELMSCSLYSFLSKNGPLPFDKVSDFSYQLFSALEYLHTNLRILHRDIKPGNILVAHSEQRIKLSDFDCAALLDEWNVKDEFRGDPQGTIHYNPPELYRHRQSSFSLDIWQAACCVLFMLTGFRPWRHLYFDCDVDYKQGRQARFAMQQKIGERQRHILPGFLPPTLHTILSRCLQDDWKSRPSAIDVMYQLDPNDSSRSKLLSNLDIIHEPGPYVSSSKPTTMQTHSQAIDVYLVDRVERLPGLFLRPGWIASIPITEPVTYGRVRELIYSNTELEVMKYLSPSRFYVYENDRIKIRQLLDDDKLMEHVEVMDNDTIVDTTKAIVMQITKYSVPESSIP